MRSEVGIHRMREPQERDRVGVSEMRASIDTLVQVYATVMALALLGLAIWGTSSLPIHP